MKKSILLHADDFAITVNTSTDIIDCLKNDHLEEISIICNMSAYEDSMRELYQSIPELRRLPLLSIHINLVEGKALSGDNSLISMNGLIKSSWLKLFFTPIWKKSQLKKELKKEIKLQLDKAQKDINNCFEIAINHDIPFKQQGLRIDFHQHAHCIPVVWEALNEVIKEGDYHIEHIRNPKEPLYPFFNRMWFTYKPINFVKNRVLMFLSEKIDRYDKTNNLEPMYMIGLMMSGEMDDERLKVIIPKMTSYSKKKNRELEILFHPGKALDHEINSEFNTKAAKSFYLSDNRHMEKKTLSILKETV